MPTDESFPASSLPSFEVGQKLAGVYVLRSQSSSEPDGTIWLAHDEVLGKDVSLHFIPSLLRSDERAMGEIRQEIKRNRQLIHPGILRVYDLVEEPDWSAISMDAFDGESLASALKAKPGGFFEPAEIKAWLQQVCHTLDDIHKIQIFHRHIAPHNIFVDGKGKVLLAKFGISRVIEDAVTRLKKGAPDPHLALLSPQCLDGENPSKADDIYSIGATTYELLTGELPFVGPDLVAQIRKNPPTSMMDRRAKLNKRGGTILPVWEKWVAAALAKPSTDRPASAGELAAKLGLTGKLTSEPTAVAAPVSPKGEEPKKAPVKEPAKETEKAAPKSTEPETAAPGGLSHAAAIAAIAAATSPEKAIIPQEAEKTAATASKPKEPAAPEIKLPAAPAKAEAKPDARPEAKMEKTPAIAAAAVEVPKGDEPELITLEKKPSTAKSFTEPAVPATSPRSSALIFGGLIVLVAGLAYFLNRPDEPKGDKPGTPVNVPATPKATPTPVAATPGMAKVTPTPTEATPPPKVVAVEPTATPPRATPTVVPNNPPPLFVASDDPQKDYLNAISRKESADKALAEAEKAVAIKGKEIGPTIKAGDQIQTQRTERLAQVKAADEAATAARAAAEAKARNLEDVKKAQADWEKENAPKLAALDKATSEFRSLEDALVQKRQEAAAATQLATAADTARQQHAMLQKKAAEEAEKARVTQQKKEDEEKAKVAAEEQKRKADLALQIKKLKDELAKLTEQANDAPTATPVVRATATPSATPIPATPPPRPSTPTPAPATPMATPKVIPPSPPPPRPVPGNTGNVQNDMPLDVPANPRATPPIVVANIPATPVIHVIPSSPPPVSPATPPPTVTENGSEIPAGESSLGLKFAPVGDVAFCVWPTRVKDFEVFAKETGFRANSWKSPGFKQGPDHPVVNVSWNDAINFCKWLTERDRKKGALTKDQSYRLPTDLEWSRAVGLPEEVGKTPEARDMGVSDVFPWGTQWPPPPNVGNYTGEETGSDVAIKGYEDGFAWTSPVGTFPANKLGLYDIGGNVWQWCMDNWSAESKAKVLRGASWYNGALKLSLLSSCRVHANADSSTDNYGFRIVRIGADATKGARSMR